MKHGSLFFTFIIIALLITVDCIAQSPNEIKLIKNGGVYEVPVILNNVLSINFILDSGAADVSISPDVALTLIKTKTITDNDWLPGAYYRFADGSTAKSKRFNLKSIKIGNVKLTNVTCSISNSIEAPMLLGQSALQKLGRYSIDYNKMVIKLNSKGSDTGRYKDASRPKPREIKRDGRFIAYSDGTVLDTRNNLMWAAKDNGFNVNWYGANNYWENYSGGGYTDWRLPTIKELETLFDINKPQKIGDFGQIIVYSTELIQLTYDNAWSSDIKGECNYFLSFDTGHNMCFEAHLNWDLSRALPVRSAE